MEPERLFECLPISMRPSPEGDSGGNNQYPPNHPSGNSADSSVYTPPTLIPLSILPLLHNLARQMIQAGHQQEVLRIYQ